MNDHLRALAHRPAPFATGGAAELWTDPHVQQEMLQAHLDPDVDAASPRHGRIDRAAAWLVQHLAIDAGTRVLDLGCGPGLYVQRLAAHAGHVHGIDLSTTSIAEARRRTPSPHVTLAVGNYLEDALPAHDVAILLMYDYGVLSPADRHRLLTRVREAMAPGGRLALDVLGTERYEFVHEICRIEERLDDGFWAAGDYVGVAQTFRYDDVRVSLDRYLIVEPTRTRWVHNWTAYLTVEELTTELERAGFTVEQVLEDLTGTPLSPSSDTLAVVAAAGE